MAIMEETLSLAEQKQALSHLDFDRSLYLQKLKDLEHHIDQNLERMEALKTGGK